MECITFSKASGYPFPFRLQIHSPRLASPSVNSYPLNPSSRKKLALLRASNQPPPPPPKALESLTSLLKPALLSFTAAAAVYFSRHSLAAAVHSPPAQSETLISSDTPSEQILEEKESLRALVEAKVKDQKLPEAIAVLDRLILMEPRDLDLHLLKAHLHTYNGDMERAKEGFEDVLKMNPLVVEAYHGLVMAASHSHDAKQLSGIVLRVEEVMKVCENEKKQAELRDLKLLVAQVRIIEGRYQEALKIYHDMVEEEPRDFRPYLCQGIVYTLLKKADEADKNFKQYRKLVPKDHPYSQLFESSLSGINAAMKKKTTTNNAGSAIKI